MTMLIPANLNFNGQGTVPAVYRGGIFEVELELFENEAHTVKYNIEGYTVAVEIEGVIELTEGNGVTVTSAKNGQILIKLTNAQTLLVKNNESRNWWVKLTKTGATTFPVGGTMLFQNP